MSRLIGITIIVAAAFFAVLGCTNTIPQNEGDYVDSKRQGYSNMVWPDGRHYEGEWVDGKEHGHGTMVWANGDRYEGNWVRGAPHGQGIAVWVNGSRYDGDFWHGKRHGHGAQEWINGESYQGEWVNGFVDGRGTFITATGDRYEGKWVGGKVTTDDGIYRDLGDLNTSPFDFPLGKRPANAKLNDTIEKEREYAINELPMYGMLDKTAAQKRADEEYIETMTKDGISRANAANTAAKVAWNTYYAGDKSTAIKRFNQAWLLDPNNQLALWGFAAISFERNQVDKALEYFQMAFDSGPENTDLQRDYERVLKMIEQ